MRLRTLANACVLACFACTGFAGVAAASATSLGTPAPPTFELRTASAFRVAQSKSACTAACDRTAFRCHDIAISRKVSGDQKETLIANCLRAQGTCYQRRCGVPYP